MLVSQEDFDRSDRDGGMTHTIMSIIIPSSLDDDSEDLLHRDISRGVGTKLDRKVSDNDNDPVGVIDGFVE